MVYFSKRFDVVLSFFYEQSIACSGALFKLVYSFVDFDTKLATNPLNKFVQFYEIVVLPKLLFNIKMLASSGPVLHLPEILFFKLFQSY